MRNLTHGPPRVNPHYLHHIPPQSRQLKIITPMTPQGLALFLNTEPWYTADPVSRAFEYRYRVYGGLTAHILAGMVDVRRIESGGDVRVEFALYGQTIIVYAGDRQDEAACTPQFIAA
jgi:hypothetical protein